MRKTAEVKFDEGADAHAMASDGEVKAPEYRVSFWSRRGPQEAWWNQWVGITEADADEVIAWAIEHARGRHFTIWARSGWGDGKMEDIRLVGGEPEDVGGDDWPSWARRPGPQAENYRRT